MQAQEPAVMCTLNHANQALDCNGKCWHCQHNVDYPATSKNIVAVSSK